MLNNEITKRKQDTLIKYLKYMASDFLDDNQKNHMINWLGHLYSDNFRHKYADFFQVVVEISQDNKQYNFDYLTVNLEEIQKILETRYTGDDNDIYKLYQSIKKLNDHINLEIGRYNYYSKNEEKLLDIEKKNSSLQEQLRTATEELDQAKEKVNSVQTELIVVLSIFAAIVLAFSGGISVIGNSLSSVENAPVFKAMLFLLVSGFVVFNTIFLLMYLIGKITNRNIYAHCKTPDCSCGVGGQPQCYGINRVRKRLPYVFWINIIFFIFMTLDILLWCLDKFYL